MQKRYDLDFIIDKHLILFKYNMLTSLSNKKNFCIIIRCPLQKNGLIKISRIHGIKEKKNSVFTKAIIHSDKKQIKKMNFGFSSRVKVLLNDKLLFSGQDVFRSRDYRFLGTMGFYDDVYLQLNKGKNELWMAVSEDLQFKGGWGYKSKIENRDGINIETK